jgi:hypothetical protein
MFMKDIINNYMSRVELNSRIVLGIIPKNYYVGSSLRSLKFAWRDNQEVLETFIQCPLNIEGGFPCGAEK